jgi:hypothetical protein
VLYSPFPRDFHSKKVFCLFLNNALTTIQNAFFCIAYFPPLRLGTANYEYSIAVIGGWLYLMNKIKEPDIFVGSVAAAPSYNALPTIKALLFHVQKPLRRTCLVDAGEHLEASLSVSSGPQSDAYYEFRLVDPPDTLNNLVQNGAKLGLSRLGAVRVWSYGKIVAAESDADCKAHCARKLVEDEIFYATVFLFSIGLRWSDPDQGEE